MIAPIPRAVKSSSVSERFICRSGAAASAIKRSGLLVLNQCEAISGKSCHRAGLAVNHNFPMRGPQVARLSSMLNLSAANLIGGCVFGSIGFVAFVYGKRMNLWRPMFLGIALMIYPYFVSNDAAMIAIGAIGTASLFFLRG